MKKSLTFMALFVSALGFVQSGCNDSQSSSTPQQQAGTAASPSPVASPTPSPVASVTPSPSPSPSPVAKVITWTQITETTRCESEIPSTCPGYYGFTVQNDGTYFVGPSVSGGILFGSLLPSEFERVVEIADPIVSLLSLSPLACTLGTGIPGSSDLVTLLTSDNVQYTLYQQTTTQYCYMSSAQQATDLDTLMNQLMREYYPTPFPAPVVSPTPTPSPTASPGYPVKIGDWGGNGIRLEVTSSDATVFLTCAEGDIKEALILDSNQEFSVTGTITLLSAPSPGPSSISGPGASPGPSPSSSGPGTSPPKVPATFSGSVNGNSMILTVTYKDLAGKNHQTPYALIFGQMGTVTPCS